MQIVHDLKNQLNGLKLYATFLRKRMEKGGRPDDELETIGKLISGLERGATDMTLLVRYGRPLELRTQAGTDLSKLLADTAGAADGADGAGSFEGDFDPALLAEALKAISTGGADPAGAPGQDGAAPPSLRLEGGDAVIEWRGPAQSGGDGGDPFRAFNGGPGLRLAMAAKIIRAHGGDVSAEGGVVRARLPLSKS